MSISPSNRKNHHLRHKVPQIAILIESSHELPRAMLRGIMRYVRLYGPWSLYIIGGGSSDQRLPDMKKWGGNGIIARIPNLKMEKDIARTRKPTVLISPKNEYFDPSHPFSRCAMLSNDSEAVRRMAADYFLERQFVHFAFLEDPRNTHWSLMRQSAFIKRLNKSGFDAFIYSSGKRKQSKTWWEERHEVVQWLTEL